MARTIAGATTANTLPPARASAAPRLPGAAEPAHPALAGRAGHGFAAAWPDQRHEREQGEQQGGHERKPRPEVVTRMRNGA